MQIVPLVLCWRTQIMQIAPSTKQKTPNPQRLRLPQKAKNNAILRYFAFASADKVYLI